MLASDRRRPSVSAVARLLLASSRDRPVFIGGCPRSGTTLLAAMLNAHPGLAIPPETRFVIESYRRAAEFGDLRDERNRLAVARWIVNSRKTRFQLLHLDPDRVIARLCRAPPTIGSLSGAVLAEFAAVGGAARWGDKRPMYVQQLGLMFRLFPDMQFVHLIRDARGCSASLKKLGWWGYGFPEALWRWHRSIASGLAARRRLRPDQYIELRYEDLVAEPERQLRRLCDALGLPYRQEMLHHDTHGAELIDRPYHERVLQPVDSTAVEKWRESLEPDELALVEAKVGPLLDEYGYERLHGLPDVPPELDAHYTDLAVSGRGRLPSARGPAITYDRDVAARLSHGQRRLYRAARVRDALSRQARART